MERIFIIGPVRNVDAATYQAIASHVARLEAEGHKVHWPARGDTNQDDPIGLRICTDNREAIYLATRVDVWFDETSMGSKFDLGMLYYFLGDTHKAFRVINERALGWRTSPVTLEDVLSKLCIALTGFTRKSIYISNELWIEVNTNVPDCLFFMGMAFASLRNQSKKIFISNSAPILPTPHKSFENVFLELAK